MTPCSPGRRFPPAWNDADVEAGEIAPLYPLAVNSAWTDESRQSGERADDAALAAGDAFRAALRSRRRRNRHHRGLRESNAAPCPAGARQLAAVESATVAEQIEQMLLISDNYLAEALARVRSAGMPAAMHPSTGAVDTVTAQSSGARRRHRRNGPGRCLRARQPRTEISARQLADAVQAVLSAETRACAPSPAGLPVAGLSGTLQGRYDDGDDDAAGAGLVRAKTGTLLRRHRAQRLRHRRRRTAPGLRTGGPGTGR